MVAWQHKGMRKGDLIVAAAVLLLAGILTLFLLPRQEQALTVQVMQDGKVLLSRPLSEIGEPVLFEIDGEFPLVLELSKQGVQVAETSCPGEDCLHTGTITDAGRQVICLPNRLIVTLQGADPGYDAVTG